MFKMEGNALHPSGVLKYTHHRRHKRRLGNQPSNKSYMKPIFIPGIALVAILMFSGAAAQSASAQPCWQVATAGDGVYTNTHCSINGPPNEYIRGTVVNLVGPLRFCIKVETAGTGNYTTGTCGTRKAGSNFALVKFVLVCAKDVFRGIYNDPVCSERGGKKEYLKIVKEVLPNKNAKGEACVPVGEAGTGAYGTEGECLEGATETSEGEYVAVPVSEKCGEIEYLVKAHPPDSTNTPIRFSRWETASPPLFADLASTTRILTGGGGIL